MRIESYQCGNRSNYCLLYTSSGDLKYAKIYVSLLGSQEEVKNTWAALQSSLGYLRREIGHRIKLRCTPELSFQIDKSLDHSVHIQELLDKIKKNEAN